MGKHLVRHADREINRGVVVVDLNATDIPRVDASLVGNGTNDIAGLHTMTVANFETEAFHAGRWRCTHTQACTAFFALGAGRPRIALEWPPLTFASAALGAKARRTLAVATRRRFRGPETRWTVIGMAGWARLVATRRTRIGIAWGTAIVATRRTRVGIARWARIIATRRAVVAADRRTFSAETRPLLVEATRSIVVGA